MNCPTCSKHKEMFRLITDPDIKTKIGWMVIDEDGDPVSKDFFHNYACADALMEGLRYDDYFDQPEYGDGMNIIKVIIARIHKNDWRVVAFIDPDYGMQEFHRDTDGGCFQADIGLKEL